MVDSTLRPTIWSSSGVHQGDPLGPLYFCFGLSSLVEEISQLAPVYQKWYMDDGGIVAPVSVLVKVWEILLTKGPVLGLHLNPPKCEWSWLKPRRVESCPSPGCLLSGRTKSPCWVFRSVLLLLSRLSFTLRSSLVSRPRSIGWSLWRTPSLLLCSSW